MANYGSADYRQLQAFADTLKRLEQADTDAFCKSASRELAARLLAMVIKRTPVGEYPKESGKTGGTLRRGWTAGTDAKGGQEAVADYNYAKTLPIVRSGDNYTVNIINPVEYASYVEFGHRQQVGRYVPAIGKCLVSGWAKGKFMLTISEQDLERVAPSVLENMLEKFLRKAFNG